MGRRISSESLPGDQFGGHRVWLVGEQHGELVAAQPRNSVHRAQRVAHPLGDGGEDGVAGLMTSGFER